MIDAKKGSVGNIQLASSRCEKRCSYAGIVRLRPVMITAGATVLGLVPLAMHGGPLWEPLC